MYNAVIAVCTFRVFQLPEPSSGESGAEGIDEVEETDIEGFVGDEQALVCSNVAFDQLLQVCNRLGSRECLIQYSLIIMYTKYLQTISYCRLFPRESAWLTRAHVN